MYADAAFHNLCPFSLLDETQIPLRSLHILPGDIALVTRWSYWQADGINRTLGMHAILVSMSNTPPHIQIFTCTNNRASVVGKSDYKAWDRIVLIKRLIFGFGNDQNDDKKKPKPDKKKPEPKPKPKPDKENPKPPGRRGDREPREPRIPNQRSEALSPLC